MTELTPKGIAEAITKAGGGEELIASTLKDTFAKGYDAGYVTAMRDVRKARASKKKVASTAFKVEIDIIDDVMRSKWL